jgi:leucyl-tRNA synthetase
MDDMKIMKLLHKTIKKVGEDIENYKFNTAISALIIAVNEGLPHDMDLQKEWKETFIQLLSPFAPHAADELWNMMGNTGSVYGKSWPQYQDFMLQDDEVTIVVQINGKVRGNFQFLNGVAQEEVSSRVHEEPEIRRWLE